MHMRRLERALHIRDSIMRSAHWQPETLSGIAVLSARMGGLLVLHSPIEANVRGTSGEMGLDVWADGLKVFSAWWKPTEPDDSVEVVTLRGGDWERVIP